MLCFSQLSLGIVIARGLQRDVIYFLADQQRPRILARLRGEGSCGVSANEYSFTQEPLIMEIYLHQRKFIDCLLYDLHI